PKAHFSLRRGTSVAASCAIIAVWKRRCELLTPHPFHCGPFSASTIGRPSVVHFPSFSEVGLTVCASAGIEPTAHRPQASRKMVLLTRPWSAIMESLHKRQLWTIQPKQLISLSARCWDEFC